MPTLPMSAISAQARDTVGDRKRACVSSGVLHCLQTARAAFRALRIRLRQFAPESFSQSVSSTVGFVPPIWVVMAGVPPRMNMAVGNHVIF